MADISKLQVPMLNQQGTMEQTEFDIKDAAARSGLASAITECKQYTDTQISTAITQVLAASY